MKVHLTRASSNVKTGPIPVSTSSADTCPTTCGFRGNGCYAENFPLSLHWRAVTAGERGMPWDDFIDEVSRFRKGQLWRHNQAGDLPGAGDKIDGRALKQLVKANKGKKGFTYTHYPPSAHNVKAIYHAVENGFTVNLSADSLTEADALYQLGMPVVAVVPEGWRGTRSPAGNPVTVCPAQVMEQMDCATCQLCANPNRKAIVAFEAHGARKKTVIKISQEKS
jgi:hypothetical protein